MKDARRLRVVDNVYGHGKRLRWLARHLRPDGRIVEVGCGTGAMITLPLLRAGYNVVGVDPDVSSIEFGRRLLVEEGFERERLCATDLSTMEFTPDALIVSEVLEHLSDAELERTLSLCHEMLAQGGQLLVTVPNGFGWFELESYLWFKLRLGRVIQRFRLDEAIWLGKQKILRVPFDESPLSTLAHSPHVRRFSRGSAMRLLTRSGFRVQEVEGSVLLAGPFSHLLFGQIKPLMRANHSLGSLAGPLAAGFYIACTRP